MHIGTVVGAVAAIGSLVFTGVATYYGAVVAQQQLEQAREDNEQRVQDQAARVTFWERNRFWAHGGGRDRPRAGAGRQGSLHLVNRSPDPVTNISVFIDTVYKGEDGLLLLADDTLPPLHRNGLRHSAAECLTGGRGTDWLGGPDALVRRAVRLH